MLEPQNLYYIIEGTFFVGVLGFLWKLSSDTNKQISAVFRRFDEHKVEVEKTMKDNYVHKDVIKVQLDHNNKDLERLEKKVDDGFHGLDKKLDRIISGKSKD